MGDVLDMLDRPERSGDLVRPTADAVALVAQLAHAVKARQSERPADVAPARPMPRAWGPEHAAFSSRQGLAVAERSAEWVPCPACRDVGALPTSDGADAGYEPCSCDDFDRRCARYSGARVPLLSGHAGVNIAALGERNPRGFDWSRCPAVRDRIAGWCTASLNNVGPPVLVLAGPTGTGKTHMAAGLVHWATLGPQAAKRRWRPAWARWREYLDAASSTRQTPERLARLLDAGLLVLDELTVHGREWGADAFCELVDVRSSARAPLVITTNLRPSSVEGEGTSQLEDRIGDRSWSRLCSSALVVEVIAADYRRRAVGQLALAEGER